MISLGYSKESDCQPNDHIDHCSCPCRTKPYATVVVVTVSPNNDGVQNVICQFVCDYRYRQFCNLENRLPL